MCIHGSSTCDDAQLHVFMNRERFNNPHCYQCLHGINKRIVETMQDKDNFIELRKAFQREPTVTSLVKAIYNMSITSHFESLLTVSSPVPLAGSKTFQHFNPILVEKSHFVSFE